jgi:hypothetical protein
MVISIYFRSGFSGNLDGCNTKELLQNIETAYVVLLSSCSLLMTWFRPSFLPHQSLYLWIGGPVEGIEKYGKWVSLCPPLCSYEYVGE